MKTKAPDKKEKYIALNYHTLAFLFAVFVGFLFSWFGYEIEEKFFAVGGIVIALIFAFLLVVSPTHYVFTNEKLVIFYPFIKRREIILWEDVTGVMSFGSWFYKTIFGLPYFKIYYRHEKDFIFLIGQICRSRRTKRLLQKYYKGNIK